MNDFTPEQVKDMAEAMTQSQLIKHFQPSSRGFFVRFLKKHNITPKKHQKFDPPMDDVIEMAKTLCNNDLAKHFKTSRMTMDRFCKKHKIQTADYEQTEDTKAKRAESLKEASKRDPSLNERKTRAIRSITAKNTGKTVEEIYGEEKGKVIRRDNSERFKGQLHSEETKEKMSISQLARPPMSEETRRRISESRKQGFLDGSIKLSPQAGFGKGGFKEDIGHYVRSSYEHTFASMLQENNITYEYEPETFHMVLDGIDTSYTPDFLIDGKYYEVKNSYNATEQLFLDKKAYMEYNLGIKVIVLIGPEFNMEMLWQRKMT